MDDILVRLCGLIGTVIAGDTGVYDRWIWLRKNIISGPCRTLEAGCGSGAFSFFAATRGNSVIGASFDLLNNRKAQRRASLLNLKNCSFQQIDLRELDISAPSLGQFDQIICFETIEHIINDKKLLRDFSGIMKRGGKLLLTVPYKYYCRLPGDTVSDFEDGGHVRWGYTHNEMETILIDVGFRIQKKEYVSGFISQQLIRLNRAVSHFDFRLAWAIVFPLRVLTIFDPILTPLLRYPYLSIAVIAEKE